MSEIKGTGNSNIQTREVVQQGSHPAPDLKGGPSFQEALSKLQQMGPSVAPAASPAMGGLKFSNHAIERMQSRGVSFNPQDLTRLNEAVQKAAAKGSKDSLILMNDSALIVSVKNNTVVTVMDKNALKENVFTNIDSTIVM
ncbi:MAG: TIGR02530 family flagellar biosynthesis protein [Pseudobdellovibrionaceae bacterium]